MIMMLSTMTAFILTLNYIAALCAIMHNVCLISVPNETLGEQDRGNSCLAKSKMMMLMLLLLMVLVKKRKEWGSMVVTMITRDGDENDCEIAGIMMTPALFGMMTCKMLTVAVMTMTSRMLLLMMLPRGW